MQPGIREGGCKLPQAAGRPTVGSLGAIQGRGGMLLPLPSLRCQAVVLSGSRADKLSSHRTVEPLNRRATELVSHQIVDWRAVKPSIHQSVNPLNPSICQYVDPLIRRSSEPSGSCAANRRAIKPSSRQPSNHRAVGQLCRRPSSHRTVEPPSW